MTQRTPLRWTRLYRPSPSSGSGRIPHLGQANRSLMREPGRGDFDRERKLVNRAAFVVAIASGVAAVTCTAASAGYRWSPAVATTSGHRKSRVTSKRASTPRIARGFPASAVGSSFRMGRSACSTCDTKREGRLCFAIKVKVVKGARRGWFRTIPVNLSRVNCTGVREVPARDRPTVAEDQSELRAAASSVQSTSARDGG